MPKQKREYRYMHEPGFIERLPHKKIESGEPDEEPICEYCGAELESCYCYD